MGKGGARVAAQRAPILRHAAAAFASAHGPRHVGRRVDSGFPPRPPPFLMDQPSAVPPAPRFKAPDTMLVIFSIIVLAAIAT